MRVTMLRKCPRCHQISGCTTNSVIIDCAFCDCTNDVGPRCPVPDDAPTTEVLCNNCIRGGIDEDDSV